MSNKYHNKLPEWHEMVFCRHVEQYIKDSLEFHLCKEGDDWKSLRETEIDVPDETPTHQFNAYEYSIYGYVKDSSTHQGCEELLIVCYNRSTADGGNQEKVRPLGRLFCTKGRGGIEKNFRARL